MVVDPRRTKAVELLAAGYSVIPMDEGKSPLVRWGKYCEAPMRPDEWTFPGANVAMLTGEINGYVVVDCDSLESYKGWLKHRPPTPLRTRSKRGMHFWYKHPGEYVKSDAHVEAKEGFEYDVKGDRSYVLIPPSMRDGHQYQWCICTGNIAGEMLPPDRLPVFDMAWRPARETTFSSNGSMSHVRSYISKINAIEGSGGDSDTFRVCKIIFESGVSQSEGMAILSEWNQTNANPPWDVMDLHRKLSIAYGASR